MSIIYLLIQFFYKKLNKELDNKNKLTKYKLTNILMKYIN